VRSILTLEIFPSESATVNGLCHVVNFHKGCGEDRGCMFGCLELPSTPVKNQKLHPSANNIISTPSLLSRRIHYSSKTNHPLDLSHFNAQYKLKLSL
jgi:hypothetical protein